LKTADGDSKPPKRTKKTPYQRYRYEPAGFDLRGELYRILGADLTDVAGISSVTAHTILCEVGTDVSRFRNASAFASWLGLCPERQISGGQVLYTKSPRVRNRVALALRLGAYSLHHPTTISVSSSVASHASLENLRPSRQRPTSLHASSFTCSTLRRRTARAYSADAKRKPSSTPNFDCASMLREWAFNWFPLQTTNCSLGASKQARLHRVTRNVPQSDNCGR